MNMNVLIYPYSMNSQGENSDYMSIKYSWLAYFMNLYHE